MTEEAPVLGRMPLGQRCLSLGIMAFLTKFFRLFLFHCVELLVDTVMGEFNCCFRRRRQEKEDNSQASGNKYDVVQEGITFFWV